MTIALAQGPQQSNALSFSLGSPTAAGNCLVVCISSFVTSGTVTGVTLGGSADNFTQADGAVMSGAGTWIWYDWNCAGGQTAIVVSGTLNVGSGQGLIVAFEVSGLLAAAAVLDQHLASGVTSATFDSGVTGTTAQASEIWFGCAECNSAITAFPGAPWTNSTQTFSGAGYQITSSAGTAQYTGTQTSSGVCSATVATFKGAAGGVTSAPQRYGQAAPPSPAPWEQRPYRSIPGAADTPANPLATPLDSAWQADAQYSHLYGDSHLRDRRQYFTQRPLVSDPSLLGTVAADPLALNPEQSPSSDAWRVAAVPAFYDRREVPQQRVYYDTTLLATAELENELLGGADAGRHWLPAAFTDRRLVPQQRLYVSDPLLLTTAELENELLGGAQTPRTYGTPATHYVRWQMPQQPPRLADPLLIATALLENELLGGGQAARYYLTAAYADRREVSWQPPRWPDPALLIPPVPFDPVLGGQDDLGRRWRQAATHYDRREVPQQRPYISDPSFYPSGAVTDPLTAAWGAGGGYWHLYNRAAEAADRREVPQQRNYVSDPLLLSSALLENELLGGAEAGKYYRTPASHAPRWQMPQQPARLADPALITTAELENELLGGADSSRHYLIAACWDRRGVPQQRAAVQLLTPPVPLDPVLAAWADLARRYLLAATHADRRLVPAQRLYFPVPLPPPPFSVGLLTAADTPLAVLSAAAAATGTATLTASDTRTGGPGG